MSETNSVRTHSGAMQDHVGHRVSFTAVGAERGRMECVDCDEVISTGSIFGRVTDEPQVVTGTLVRGGSVVDGVAIPSTFTLR